MESLETRPARWRLTVSVHGTIAALWAGLIVAAVVGVAVLLIGSELLHKSKDAGLFIVPEWVAAALKAFAGSLGVAAPAVASVVAGLVGYFFGAKRDR